MKIKRSEVLLLISIIIFMFIGCKKAPAQDPVKNDLMNYISSVSEVFVLEENVLKEYRKVVGENYKEEDTHIIIKKIVIPKYTEFVQTLDNIKPKTDEVKQLHEIYKKAAYIRLEAFRQMEEGFEKKEGTLVKETDKKLDEAQNSINKYRDQLTELAEKHKIKIKIK
ncbi:hypothetical protein [Clostridium ganghwense]|uniref:Lipoprotein n=1 Tax=Clostridium ganghwense TaxID=312089 RepID=A0ABT4CM50_9CLOT|nr:hypothetical protein [Clostridium ganghwense]MCY6369074.1 hypothetical protein [Clostridium ganghwense]